MSNTSIDSKKHSMKSEIKDLTTITEHLWAMWPAIEQSALQISNFHPGKNSSLHIKIDKINAISQSLCLNDDFLQILYNESVQPKDLYIRDGVLHGTSSSTHESKTFQEMQNNTSSQISRSTKELITALTDETGSLQNLHPYHTSTTLSNAIAFYMDNKATTIQTKGEISGLILSVERKIRSLIASSKERSAKASTEEHDVSRSIDLIDDLKKQNIRYIENLDPWARPSPNSPLGYKLALSRQALFDLSSNSIFQEICTQHSSDPWNICFSNDGKIKAVHNTENILKELEDHRFLVKPLSGLKSTLQELSDLLQTELSSRGDIRLSKLLDYYAIPHDISQPDWGTDESLEHLSRLLKQRLTQKKEPPQELPPTASAIYHRLAPNTYKSITLALWSAYDNCNSNNQVYLSDIDFNEPSKSPIQKEWQRAQRIIFELYRTPSFWLMIKSWNLSINSLSITKSTLSLSDINKKDRRTTFIAEDFNDATLKKKIKLLLRLADRLSFITPGHLPSLSSALFYYYRQSLQQTPPPSLQQNKLSRWETLAIIDDLFQHHDDISFSSYYLDERGDLEELYSILLAKHTPMSPRYRPPTGTVLGKKTYRALNDFLTLFPAQPPSNTLNASFFYYTATNEFGEFIIKSSQDQNWTLNALSLENDLQRKALENLESNADSSNLTLSSDGKIILQEALNYYLPLPLDLQEDKKTIVNNIESQIGRLGCGLRHDFIDASKLLSLDDNIIVKNEISRYLKKQNCNTTLFEFLGNQALKKNELTWSSTERWLYFLYTMISSESAHALVDRILKSLHWYRSSVSLNLSPINSSLLIHALLIDLDPSSNRVEKKILGYSIDNENNYGRPYTDIYNDFKIHVKNLGRVSTDALDMICLFAANRLAPELLTSDTAIRHDASLMTAEYVSAVNLAEALAGGSSQNKTTSELLSLPNEMRLESTDNDIEEFIMQQRWQPVLHWAKFRQETNTGSKLDLDDHQVKDILDDFEKRKEEVQQALVNIGKSVPDRMSIVRAEILRVFPQYPDAFSNEAWNTPNINIYHKHETINTYPFYEVYASGEIPDNYDNWSIAVASPPLGQHQPDLKNINSARKHAYSKIKERAKALKNIGVLFKKQHDDYVKKLSHAYKTLSEEALFQLPAPLLDSINKGDFEIFTLRPAAPGLEAQQESPAITNRLRGRLGVLLKINHHETTTYYQFLPLQGLCLALPRETNIPIGGHIVSRRVRTPKGGATISVREGTPLPVDWSAYLLGTNPDHNTTSSLIVEPLLIAPPTQADTEPHSPFLAITQALVNDLLLNDKETLERLSWGETSLESDREKSLLSKTVDLLVPFVENIRTLINSKPTFDPVHFSSAAFWLYAEIILLAIPFSKNLSKLITNSKSIKLSALSETSLKSLLEALNPVSGFVSSIKLAGIATSEGYKLSHRELLRRYRRFRLSSVGWRCHSGVALLRQRFTSLFVPASERPGGGGAYHLMIKSTDSGASFYLVDPTTFSSYGPRLERQSIYDAAGVMSNVLVKSQSLLPSSLASKVLTSGKSVTRLSEDDEAESYYELLEIESLRV